MRPLLKKIIFILLFFNLFLLSACATMFNAGSQTVLVRTRENKPVKIKVTAPYQDAYETQAPTIIRSYPNSFIPLSLEVVDECYGELKRNVPKYSAASYWLNLANLYGFLIDPLTGFMWLYDEEIYLPLVKAAKPCERDSEKTMKEVFRFTEKEPSSGVLQKTGGWSLIGAGSLATLIGSIRHTDPVAHGHSESNGGHEHDYDKQRDWIVGGLTAVVFGIGLVVYGEQLGKDHKLWRQKKNLQDMSLDLSFAPKTREMSLVYRYNF